MLVQDVGRLMHGSLSVLCVFASAVLSIVRDSESMACRVDIPRSCHHSKRPDGCRAADRRTRDASSRDVTKLGT